ncbi:MAG: PKD domain-containing protein [Flavobacterium sp.]|nr:PKD domain-containing protein [Flavobacterium sp.]
MKKLYHLIFFLFISCAFSQNKIKDTTTRKATISFEKNANVITFRSQNPPLIQVLGAPPANFTNFWEFGDGSYSKEKEPKKVYKKKGNYKVNLSLTNNYDNGKPPSTRPKIVAVNEILNEKADEIASLEKLEGYQLQFSREPIPDEELVIVMSYQNVLNYVSNGKLYLFYNDKEFKNKNFELLETRTHFGEKEVNTSVASVGDYNSNYRNLASSNNYPSFSNSFLSDDENLEMTLAESKSLFYNFKILEFDGMNPSETRNVFFSFKTTPEMIKDTSATVKMRGIYVPDRNYKSHKKRTLEMEIVTSHDPNKMSSNATSMNYRTVRLTTINFKTRFQNNGEGPAKMIRLETDIPEMFDKKTLQIVDSYPKCPICPKGEITTTSCLDTIIKKDQIYFTFKNIYIPGSNQKNVKEIDSTKGYVKYSMKFAKNFHKIKTKSKTAIIFDKNEPVITNYAVTKFKTGISIGAKAGCNIYSSLDNSKSYFVATTLSPYKSYKWYCQAELQNSFNSYDGKIIETERTGQFQTPPNGTLQLEQTFSQTHFKNINLEIPILVRYNLNNFIGVGTGIQGNINLSEKQYTNQTINQYENTTTTFLVTSTQNSSETSGSFKNFNGGVLFDLTAGVSRIGPSIGARYVVNFKKNFNYLQLYGIWKF